MFWIYYNLMNYFWFYRCRAVYAPIHQSDAKSYVTEVMLRSVGLMISDTSIPSNIWLSDIQKKSKLLAESHGFKVGLLK